MYYMQHFHHFFLAYVEVLCEEQVIHDTSDRTAKIAGIVEVAYDISSYLIFLVIEFTITELLYKNVLKTLFVGKRSFIMFVVATMVIGF